VGLILEDVRKSFDSTEVLAGVSLEARDGEFVCILGPNGSGKTTILRLIAGLEPVTEGRITVDGVPADGGQVPIGYVFQQHALLPWRTVRGNIAYGLELSRKEKGGREKVIDNYLELMGLRDFAAHYPRQLSGGMQQKVGIARALALEPPIVLMDEPFAALDAQTRNILQDELLRAWGVTKNTVLFVTHSVDEAVYLADRVVVLTARPATVRECVMVDLPRPRDRTSAEFNGVRRHVMQLLGQEMDHRYMHETRELPRLRRLYPDVPETL
jgi:NitT/TauT family transport system ATP-binding protein